MVSCDYLQLIHLHADISTTLLLLCELNIYTTSLEW